MKTILICVTSMLIAAFTFGQEIQKVEEVEVTAPLFTGVENAIKVQNESANALIRQYLKDNIIYPEKAKLSKKEGTEVVQFTVTEEGNVADFKIINSICPEIDYEIIRALKNTTGMWFPGFIYEYRWFIYSHPQVTNTCLYIYHK